MKIITATLGLATVLSASANQSDSLVKVEKARQLVSLTKDFEREAQAIRFMTTDSPVPLPKNMAACMEKSSKPEIESYLSGQCADNMTLDEIDQAIAFFQSSMGQLIANLRLKHENYLFDSALKGIKVSDETLHYPDNAQDALDTFGKTPSGRFFTSDEIRNRPEIRSRISDLRSSAFEKCFSTP